MNAEEQMQVMGGWHREPRAIITETDQDYLEFVSILPRQLRKRIESYVIQGIPAYSGYLRLSDEVLRDWWRFVAYLGRNPGAMYPTKKWPNGKYPFDLEGFLRFLQNEPGRFFGKAIGTIAGFAVLGPVGIGVGLGAARGAQDAWDNETSILGGMASGAVKGYGAALAAGAPLLEFAPGGSVLAGAARSGGTFLMGDGRAQNSYDNATHGTQEGGFTFGESSSSVPSSGGGYTF
jgi:hypothetical protein